MIALTIAVAAVALVVHGTPRADAQVPDVPTADYDLGVRRFVEPGGTGRFARIPIRLWGAVAVPAGSGPAPVVVVGHGSHGDGCPGEFGDWPCSAWSSATTWACATWSVSSPGSASSPSPPT